MANRLQLRRDGAQQWANVNPILAQGELGIEIDTSRIKIGDGVTSWNSLKYERPIETESNTANTLVKRDADGNFEAGAITASLIGNSATATRLANARTISLGGDMSGSGTFDGSANLTITAELNYVVALPHYDANDLDAQGTYTRITVDSRGRIVDADSPTSLAAYGIGDAQPLDSDLTSLANMSGFGIISRQSEGTLVNRTVTGGSGRIIVQNGNGQSSNPFIDLADTTVVVGTYNPILPAVDALISATTGSQTVNTVNLTVDRYGRLTYANTSPIATATEGSFAPVYDNATAYPRYSKIRNSSDALYEAILDIGAGAGAPTHLDTSDAGSWRYLGTAIAPQKGIAAFNQEDFDVTSWDAGNSIEGGFVTIADRGVDNTQLQNNRVSFADGNSHEHFELDQELTPITGYRGFNYLNYTKVNDTTGNLLFSVNNTGDGSSGTQQLVTTIAVTVGVDTVGGQATGVFYLDAVEKPSIGLKRGVTYIFDQSDSTNETYNGMNHPLMFSTGDDGDHNGNGHYMDGITYKLDGAVVDMAGYVSGFDAATTRTVEWMVQTDAAATLYYWCHHHTDQGNSFTLTDGGAGEVDINVRTYFSDADITLDGAIDQTLDKTGSGNLDFKLTQNTTQNRALSISSTNSGSGTANLNITADNEITIASTDAAYFVNVEDYRFQQNVLSTNNSTMVLDPGDDDAATGLVQIRGDLQVDGTTTTVNSTTMTVQDPIITLGGEDTLVSDDNKDRGIEIRYYDSQERFGFFGWDEDYADSNIWSGTGGYRFLYNATNTSEVFSGTDAPVIAGNLRLTTNTSSTWKTPTTGTLVVTGGAGVSENLNVGGTTHLNGNVEIDGTVDIDANFAVRNNTTDKFTIESATGDTVIEGTVDISLETKIYDKLVVRANNRTFKVQNGSSVDKFVVDSDDGNTVIQGTVNVINAVDFDSTLNVDDNVTFNAELDVDGDVVFHNDFLMDVTGKYFTITNGSSQTFRVTSTNGNTDIEGSLNVGGVNTFERTNNITVDASTSESDITLSSGGNATFAGGVNIDKDVRIGDDLYVADRIVVKDAGINRTRPSLLNNVDILYRQYIGATTAHNASFADDPDANLRVSGGVGIVQDLHVGDDLYIGKVGTNDNVEFSVLGESGFTTIGRVGQGNATDGAILVHGYATFNERFTINGPLTTIGDANTDVLTVNAVSTFTDNVTVNGNFDVDGNAIIEGNLTVNGTTTTVNSTVTTVDDPVITLGGDTAPSQADAKDRGIEFRYYDTQARLGFFGWDLTASRFAFYHNATNSSEAFSGNRSGIDAGSLKLFDTTNATNSSSGTLIVGGGASVGIDLYVGDDLVVADAGSFGGNVDITGTLDVTNNFAVSNTFTVDAASGNTFANGTFSVNGNATIGNASGDSHTVNGTVQFNHALTAAARLNIRDLKVATDAANEISTSSGNLILDSANGTVNITDNADVDGNLNVDGNTQIDGTLTVDGNATIGNQSGDNHTVTGTVTFNQAITSTDITADAIQIGVDANNEISTTTGNLILDSADGKVHITDNAEVDGNLQVDGNSTLGDASGDTLTVNATSTFNAPITSTDITADAIRLGFSGSSEIDTTAGNLILDSAGGTVSIDDNATISGTLEVTNQVTVTDSIVINSPNESFIIRSALVDRFTVDTDNGNTFIAGTTQIEGLTTINDNVDINGNADVSGTSTLGDVVNITDTTGASTGNNFSASGALQVAGGATIAGDLAVGDDFKVYGDFEVDGNVVQKGNQEFRGRVEFTKNETASRLTGNCAIMVPNGGVAVYEDSFFGEDIFVGPDQSQTITLFGATGNITADGTITSATVAATTGNISTINTTSNVNIGGSIIVNSNKFIVSGAQGNVDIAGTVDIAGRTIIDDTLNVTQNVDFDADLNVDGNQQLDGTLTVDSTSLFKDNVVLRGASKTLTLQNGSGTAKVTLHSTTGNAEITGTSTIGTLDVTNNATIGGTLGVTGQITGNVTGDLTGTSDKANLVDVTETATSNLTYFPAFVSANTGHTEIRTDSQQLQYNPFENRLTVTNFRSTTDFEVQGNLNVTGALTFMQSQVGSIANHDTDALTEGSTNLYYTNERVDDRVAALIQGGTGIDATYNDAGNLLSLSVDFGEYTTDQVVEGSSNSYFTQARARNAFTYGTGIQHDGSGTISVTQSDINTDNLTEGSTNLFITNARTRGALSAGGDLSYNASTGVFSVTTFKTADARGSVSAGGDLSYNASTGVFSYTTPSTSGITEGTNLYYTNARADARIALQVGANLDLSNQDTADLAEGTNLYYTNARADARIALQVGANLDISNQSTSDLSEGTNLYYTDARADARIAAASTSDLSEGTNLYYTDTRADARIAAASTSDLSEGTNLYYTNARADARIAAADTGDLSEGTNLYYTQARADARVDAGFTAKSTSDLSEGTNLYYTDARADARVVAGITGKLDASAATSFGIHIIGGADAAAVRTTLGLGTAATTASTAYATAAQGALADSALQAETITLATLKTEVAASTSFADFKSRIAAL